VGACRCPGIALSALAAGAVALAGCGSSGEMPRAAMDTPLTPDETGRVDRTTTGTTGIEGGWYVYSDSTNPEGVAPGDCQNSGHDTAECSTVITPDPAAQTFPPTVVDGFGLGNCVVGVVARALRYANGSLDFTHIWGLGIGVTFNAGQLYYDAPAHGVTGVAFDIDSEPPPQGGIRVQVPTQTTAKQAAWWAGATDDTSPVHAGHNEFRWADVGAMSPPSGGAPVAAPPPFDPTRILGIQFQAMPDPSGRKTVSFCISNLTALGN
jgi:hypothetical protein